MILTVDLYTPMDFGAHLHTPSGVNHDTVQSARARG